MNATSCPLMPEWHIAHWFNTDGPLRVADLRGQVVLIHAFQMLCPGCVIHAIPQARKVHELYGDQGVAVIGLHTVFEHHDAMQPHALQAFIHEYGLRFPVGWMRRRPMVGRCRAPWRSWACAARRPRWCWTGRAACG